MPKDGKSPEGKDDKRYGKDKDRRGHGRRGHGPHESRLLRVADGQD